MSGSEVSWIGRVFEIGPEVDEVRHWSIGVADELAAAGVVEWFYVDLGGGRIEVGVRGAPPSSWPDARTGPSSLSPSLFPEQIVPVSYAELLVAGTAAVIVAFRRGVAPDAESGLRVFYEELVDDDERPSVLAAAAAWLTRVADSLGVSDPADPEPHGTGTSHSIAVPPEIVAGDGYRSSGALRRSLASIRPRLDDDVASIAAAAGVEPWAIRSQLVARAAHAHLVRVQGSGSSHLRAEAALLRSMRWR